MITLADDTNAVASLDGTMFGMTQQGSVNAAVTLNNLGTSTITYHAQQSADGFTWTEMSTIGTPLYNTLVPGQVVTVLVVSAYASVRFNASASGGSTLGFSILRYFNRSQGGNVPIMGGF